MLVAEVARALAVVPHGATVVLACSGGPDSTALAFLAAEARGDLRGVLAHVRHGLRDDTADVEVVRRHAAWLDAPLAVREVEVARAGHGIEAAARDARYRALREVAAEHDAAWILVGHTADDQAETVLLRLARGTGVDGLAAMRPVHGGIVRPLLRLRRPDVHRFVELEGLPFAVDPTNTDPALRRTLVRHELLGLLERIAPDPVGALARLAALAADDADALAAAAAGALAEVRQVGPVLAVPDAALVTLPPAVARRVVRALLHQVTGMPPDAATVARVLAARPGTTRRLRGGLQVGVAAGWRSLAPLELPRADAAPLPSGGTLVWEPAGLVLSHHGRAPRGDPRQTTLPFDPPVVDGPPVDVARIPPGCHVERLVLDLPDGVPALVVRHRASGDRIATAPGSRRLTDLLIDVGMPRAMRELWPVVAQVDGRVVWVPGVAADEALLHAGRGASAARLRAVPA